MRLFALRGATSVAANDRPRSSPPPRSSCARSWTATRGPDDVVSCIFTLTDDLDADFPAVAARHLGFDRVPLLCAREIPVPGALGRVIRVLIHYYADEGHTPRTSTSAGRADCAPTSSRRNRPMALEFSERVGASPSTRRRAPTRCQRTSRCWPPTSRPTRRCPRSSRRSRRPGRAQPLPGPDQLRAARRAERPLRGAGRAHRDRQRLVRHPARGRRSAARARRRAGLRVAVVQRLPAPGGGLRRHGDQRALNDRDEHDLDAMAQRSPPPRAWSSSATPTTRRRPRCRPTPSRRSSSACRATSA